MLCLFVLLILVGQFTNGLLPQDCWATTSEFEEFSKTLNGQIIYKNLWDDIYIKYVYKTQNVLYTAYPSWIILCVSHNDVRQSVLFSKSHNIQISILSTGHSYNGANTANNSLQINLSQLKSYLINKNELTMTVETGLQRRLIYKIIDEQMPNTVIVSGGDLSVGPGGYSLGGGHSTSSPS